jgi:uncharacterized damage-inducible protein DinB
MNEGARIAEQLWRVMVGGAWHGPAVLEALDGLHAEEAAKHPIAGAHSIWELVAHIDATQKLILARLGGESPPTSDADFFPPIFNTTEVNWLSDLGRLKIQEEKIVATAASLSDEELAAAIPGGSTAYETLHGHAQHNAFHAGQIRLLRKLIGGENR